MLFQIPSQDYWKIGLEQARELQRQLADRVSMVNTVSDVNVVAGVDMSIGRFKKTGRAAVVLLSFPELQPVEIQFAEMEITFPYVPGFLSFREAPVVLEALAKLSRKPDLVMVDGQGIAHPRRLGIASHIGLLLDLPTVGCAKSMLVGHHGDLAVARGSTSPLIDRNEVVGMAVRTKDRVTPIYVSVGHKIDLETGVKWVLACSKGYRLPEPTRLAHLAAGGNLP